MGEKLIVGPINKGLQTNREPFVIDNDSFPVLINAYQWRGRIKRRRGDQTLGRLTRYVFSTQIGTFDVNGELSINLLSVLSLESSGSIVPGTLKIFSNTSTGPFTWIENTPPNGFLITNVAGPANPSTINYATGVVDIWANGAFSGLAVFASFFYYPNLPVLGLEDFILSSVQFAQTIAFDTTYAYNQLTTDPYANYSVSFYKNPPADPIAYPLYTPKTNWTPTTWNGKDYQQFWTINYQGALWATNGINIPFSTTNIGMQYQLITSISIVQASGPAIVIIEIPGHKLVGGDFVFLNEIVGMTGINFQSGYVTFVDPDTIHVAVTLPNATVGGVYSNGGIIQYLTSRFDTSKDCLRWYDGDPTNGSATSPGFSTGFGWVNFAPPLSRSIYSIADAPAQQYYLVGARMIQTFKDRIHFFGPVIQTSSPGSQIYLQDTVIFSQNGTPYYTASFTGDPSSAATVFNPILVPPNQTATANSFWEDQTGFGGFLSAGIDQAIITSAFNEDVIIVGFNTFQTRYVYTGNDIVPFNFFSINTEYGSGSTFSTITMDRGVITRGDKGYLITNQTKCLRIDLAIPDQVFEINLTNNGNERFCCQRDFISEWMYFSYPSNQNAFKFPNQTLFYNYRDESWAIFNESYTTYGAFKRKTGFTWATVGNTYSSWNAWNDPWDAGESTLLQTEVIAGNQQGFIFIRGIGTEEQASLYIKSFSSSLVTSPDHCLNQDDYIIINGVIGTIGSQVNGKIFSVSQPTENTFILNPSITTGTYIGGGTITRLYNPIIQTKQFPTAWSMGRKTRIGVQQYLLSKTSNSQITLLIYLSMDASNPYNAGDIVPALEPENSSLIYSTVLYTCPESTNLGLTPANVNLQMPSANTQSKIYHRINTSLIGDAIQLGFTMSDTQMRAVDIDGKLMNQVSEIELHGFILDVTPSQLLS